MMNPVPPKRKSDLPPIHLTGDAMRVLNILDDLGVQPGDRTRLKPIFFRWAKAGGPGGTNLTEAIDLLATAGFVVWEDERSTVVRLQ